MNSKKKKYVSVITRTISSIIQHQYVSLSASIGLTAYSSLALFSFNPHDPSWFYYSSEITPITNAAGAWGAQLAALAFYTLGNAAYVIPTLFMYTSYTLWFGKTVKQESDRLIALITFLPVTAALLQSYQLGATPYMNAGGMLGLVLYQKLVHALGNWATIALLNGIAMSQLLIITRLSLVTVASWFLTGLKALAILYSYILLPGLKIAVRCVHMALTTLRTTANYLHKTITTTTPAYDNSSVMEFEHPQPVYESAHEPEPALATQQEAVKDTVIKTAHSMPKRKSVFTLPSLNFFSKSDKPSTATVNDEHKQLVQVLQDKLSRFGITGTVTAIKPGPVVTLFEYQPDIDTKLSKILALENDLALALEAMSVRIIAPIPGTSRVGFEVANKERKSVLMGDMVRSTLFTRSSYQLPIVLGSDTAGESVIIDLTDTPHLLVAGSTGSGKSVALNTLLLSILTKKTPDQVKLVIIDPKRLEFASYQDIPHLLFPIITQPSKAAPVLKWLVRTMEERYETMAQAGVRAISEYQRLQAQQEEPKSMPYIVVMIDELADLMMVAGKDVEESIARLAQMARAAGIHLVVATQRPSVDVITGVIKVNFPSRISFRVTSKVDSRTILDTGGAEHLLGKGDMLFMDAHSARMRRIHGAYVTDKEINQIVADIKAQQGPSYIDLQDAVAAYNQQSQQQEEPLLNDIMQFLDAVDEVSISLLQRRFKIGYNRSARIIELLEQQGKIMPADGGKTRKIVR